jgi:hypothetical protein
MGCRGVDFEKEEWREGVDARGGVWMTGFGFWVEGGFSVFLRLDLGAILS